MWATRQARQDNIVIILQHHENEYVMRLTYSLLYL